MVEAEGLELQIFASRLFSRIAVCTLANISHLVSRPEPLRHGLILSILAKALQGD
jgi:hypothetical protein